MTPWLVTGLSGQVGAALLEVREAADPPLLALSRQSRSEHDGVRWMAGNLDAMPAMTEPVSAIASLGPLDAFARWFAADGPAVERVVALGSTSMHSKTASADAAERELAGALARAEQQLADACAVRGTALTLLRPTLVYGSGRDRNLSRLVALARRWHWLPLPRHAAGRRQPVHVADVAGAVLAALRRDRPVPGAFDLPGGETLAFDEMVRRTLVAAAPRSRLVRLPDPVFRTGIRLLRQSGRLGGAGEGVLARLDQDLCFDGEPARIALSQSPRGFQPTAAMFPS